MTLLVIVLIHNRFDLAADVMRQLRQVTDEATIVIVDNGSAHSIADEPWAEGFGVLRVAENFGNYPVFSLGKSLAGPLKADVLAFLHSDLFVWEQGWDRRVREAFERDPKLGLIGVVGSSEIDENGGRGSGTVLNFQGRRGGGRAEDHGRRETGLVPAAVVDGCAMIFRRECLDALEDRETFPPHHFYDRLLSCQALEAGWRVGVLGVAVDHLGGQTAVLEPGWHALCEQWCRQRGAAPPTEGGWELMLYREAEKTFLQEYRYTKGFIPLRVRADWSIVR